MRVLSCFHHLKQQTSADHPTKHFSSKSKVGAGWECLFYRYDNAVQCTNGIAKRGGGFERKT